ncbi:MAG TPA: FtsW/RodA/SpoVE family cell cycle protein [Patescibacteria group bacterium]|nr:FtsW/RodA/SpoVE family cell cycle protein [Patescibacteria group bacterium]
MKSMGSSPFSHSFVHTESRLLLLVAVLLFNGLLIVTQTAGQALISAGTAWFIFVAGLAAVHGLLCYQRIYGDPLLLPVVTFLTAIGLTVIWRLKPALMMSQTIWIVTGLLLFLGVACLGHRLEKLSEYKYICGIVGVGLLMVTALFGIDVGGNKNWLTLGFLRFQPSEFAKLFLMVFLAAYLAEHREILTFSGRRYGRLLLPPLRFAGPLLLMVAVALVLLVVEKDLGAALLYFGAAIVMVYLACGRISYVLLAFILFFSGAAVCYLAFPHVHTRVDIWLNPWADPNGKAFQIIQSLFALGSGGLFGSGIGWGYPSLIPEVHTDFIFSAIGEEMGLLGSVAVILAYMLLIYRGFRAAIHAPTEFVSLLTGGLTAFLALQTFLIIAGVTKFMPMTGITLPYISYGGSSMAANFLLLGMIFTVSKTGISDASFIDSLMGRSLAKNLRHIGLTLLGGCFVLLLYISYLQIITGEELARHPLNHRSLQWAQHIKRGDITDIHGQKLAVSLIDAQGNYRREYPLDEIFAPVVGYYSSRYGQTGVESAANAQLSGFDSPLRRLGPIHRLWAQQAGNTLVLTLDSKLQETAYAALGQHKGSVVVLNPRSGAVLSMVSKPSFNPNTLDSDWNTISQSADSPLLNRASQGLYPPGSIIKVLVAETALAENITSRQRQFNCSGVLNIGDYQLQESNHQAHGKINLQEALTYSCNVTFGQLALELGRDRLSKAFERYGIGQLSGVDLPENADRLPLFSRLSDGDLAQMGIGQASLLVTPLKMAMLASAFANKGQIMTPYITARILGPDGAILDETSRREWLRPVNAQRAEILHDMMISVVAEGTGTAAQVRGIAIAGKTGTAENPHGASHAWFIGFAPADQPQIALAVIVENGGSGGEVAAPIARQIFMKALR